MRYWLLPLLIAVLLLPVFTFATHIIGGELTYQHLGGSQYQVTLKLFRDCGPGNAGFPNTAQIRAWYNQGSNYVPINIPYAGSSVVPPQIDSCVVNPGVCVEQAIYSQTATLPQVPGGYHIMYQLCCRNGSVLNVVNPLNVGASFYSFLPPDTAVYPPNTPTVWLEDFTLPNFTQIDNGATAWSRTIAPQTDYAEVRNNLFEAKDTDGEVKWTSQWVNISSYATGVNLSAVLAEVGTMEGTDSINIFYRVNNGPEIPFPFNGYNADDFGSVNAYAYCVTGDSIQVVCKIKNDANAEYHRLDDVRISECGLPTTFPIGNNSAPTFNNFPPIFLCQSDTFNFNHAATDPDGDSLAYKLCDPYDEYSGGVNTPPAFVGNNPVIPIIPWQTGFNAIKPLGPPRLVIDSITGMLTGIPQNVGQYVVGVCVEEWRNDSLINTTRRDFQFNIVYCPPIAQAGIDTTQATLSVCNGNAITFPNQSDPAGAPNFWDFGDLSVTTDTSYKVSPTYTYPDTGKYTVMLVTNYGTACADTVYQDVYVGYVNAGFIHDAPQCENTPVNFTDTSNASNNATINSWTWDFGDGNNSSIQNPSHPYSPGGSYTVKLIVGTDIGCTDSVTATIQIDSIPIVDAGTNQNICATLGPLSLSGTTTTGTGTWTSSGTGTFAPNPNVLNPSYNPSAADTAAGSVILYFSSTNNGACNAVKDSVVITFVPNPYAIAGPNLTVCANNAAVNLNGLVGNCTGGTWTTSGTGTFAPSANVLNPTYNPSNADTAAGTVNLTLTTTGNGSCPADTSILTITITPAPNVQAGPDQNVCAAQSSVTLAGSVGGPTTTGTWSTSGTGTFSPNPNTLPGVYVPSAADTAAGSVTLVLTSTGNGNCNAVTDTVVLTFIPSPAVTTAGSITVCANNASVPLNGTSTTGTGVWSSSGTGTFNPNNTALNASYLPSSADTAAGSVVITLISTNNGSCPADTQQLTITYSNAPAAFPGANDTVCANNLAYGLNGAVWNATGGTWITSGDGTFAPSPGILNPTYTPGPNDTTNGSVTLTLITTGNGSCLADSSTLILTIVPAPTVSAGPNQILCLNAPSASLNGTSTTGSGVWSSTGTGTFSPSSNVLTPTYTPSSADTAAGLVKLILTSSANGSCLPVTDTMTLSFVPLQVVNAGRDTTLCANNANLQLNGSVTNGPASGKWTSSGTGTFSPSDSILSPTYIPSAADTTAGSVTIRLTATYGCAPVYDSIIITFTPAPFVNAGPDQTLCNNNPNATLSGIISGGATTGVWSTPNGTGTFSPSANSLNTTYVPTPADTVAGSVTIVLTSTNNGNCLAVTDTLILTFISQPTALAGPDMTVCANDTVALSGLIQNGSGQGIWSTPNGTGTFIPSNTALNGGYVFSPADTLAGTVTLVLTSTNNGNCLPVTDTLVITITPAPYANAGPDVSVCANNANVSLNGSVGHASGGRWVSTGDGTFSPSDSILLTNYIPGSGDTANGTVKIILITTGNGICNPSTDTMTVTITPAPNVDGNGPVYVCQGTMTAKLNGKVSGGASTGQWSTLGSGTFTPSNNILNPTYNLSTADTTAGMVKLVLTSTNNGGCLAVTDTIDLIITTLATVTVGNDTTVCSSIDSIKVNGTVTGGSGTGRWTSSGTGSYFPTDSMNNPTYVPSSGDTAAGSVVLYFHAIASCLPVYDSIIVTFQTAPWANAGGNFNICEGQTIQLNGSVGNGSGVKWNTSGTGTFNPNDSTLVTAYTPSAGDIATGSVWFALQTGGLGLCPGDVDSIKVNIGSVPMADFWSSPVCQGEQLQLIDTSTVGNGTINFWSYIIGTDTLVAEDTSYAASGSTVTIKHIVKTNFGCTDTITKTFAVNPKPTAAFLWDPYCNDSVQFTDQSSADVVSWAWNFGDSTGSVLQHPGHTFPDTSNKYLVTLTVTSDSGCTASVSDTIRIPDGALADYDPHGGTFPGNQSIDFTNKSTNATSYWWDFDDGSTDTQTNPSHTYGQDGTYNVLLIAFDSLGCPDSVSYEFIIEPVEDDEKPVAVPSAFTPNGDGENDILYVRGGPVVNLNFTVFNEWGNVVFHTNNQSEGWNGKYRGQKQPNGTYVYTVTGETKSGDPIDLVGEVNILR